jgi:hypothetical protein
MADSSIATLTAKLLDLPFLLFIIIAVSFFRFGSGMDSWMSRVTELEVSSKRLRFKIGKDEVTLDKLDATITARLQELQEEIERIRTTMASPVTLPPSQEGGGENSIPPALEAILENVVYPMLKSNLWLGRYVKTLAAAASVTELTMLTFCRSRNDIGLFKDGDRWVAALSERLSERLTSDGKQTV